MNLWDGEHEWGRRLEQIEEFVSSQRVEVLCIQEVRASGEPDLPTTAEQVAAACGMQVATPNGVGYGATNAVLCSLEHHGGRLIEGPEGTSPAAMATIETPAGGLLVASVHLPWGSTNEPLRLTQMRGLVAAFDEILGDEEAPGIIAGDLNTCPESETIRFLKGLTVIQPGTLWVDAWEHRMEVDDDGATNEPANPYTRHVAVHHPTDRDPVLDAGLLPRRRIDYVFSRGWRHGRVFTPTNTRVERGYLMSDHHPVITELLLRVD